MRQYSAHGHPDHDACGTGFVCRLGAKASHEVVYRALFALQRLAHRGGVDADGSSGDGAGLLTAIPGRFIRRAAADLDIALPSDFGLGMLFLDPRDELQTQRAFAALAPEMGLKCLGWREVPVNDSVPGSRAAETLPAIWQCFLAANKGVEDLESSLFLLRKRTEAELGERVYFASLSSRTVVYKGLLLPWQLPLFYPDLHSPDFESPFAIFHQRFSTNTRPSWSLAQPFRFLAHNGEINTIVGNRRWMRARETRIRETLHVGEWFRCLEDNVSDSASLDNALEIMVQKGRSPEAALLGLMPPVLSSSKIHEHLEPADQECEPWDGPAALVFSDGRVVGAKLDRNGLRPLRYTRTADGWLVAGSESGIGGFESGRVVERQRLGPGEMLTVEISNGRMATKVNHNNEVLRTVASRSTSVSLHHPEALPSLWETRAAVADAERIAATLGWSEDQVRYVLHPLAQGKEAIWSMGDDTPPAFMSKMKLRRTLWDYCKQRFAQVTNPAIDPLREAHVMSLRTLLGPDFYNDTPVLSEPQLLFLESRIGRVQAIDVTFESNRGISGAYQALERIRREASSSVGAGADLLVISDRAVSPQRVALPILLAASAVWQEISRAGKSHVPLVVETAQVIDAHHVAMLLAVGTTAVCPFLALQLAGAHGTAGAANYARAIDAGLKKVLSRMGISTLSSYRNGQLFEVVGLDARLCREFFEDAPRFAEVRSLADVLEDYLQNHARAFAADHNGLGDAGYFRFRKEGELHGNSPEVLRKMHASIKARTGNTALELEALAASREPMAIRDLLTIVFPGGIAIDSVEPERELLRRFSTQAMSVGAVSPEVHRTLARAMNRLGARSNTGEGGEDSRLYSEDPEAACKIKQVASGRFGVSAEYLVHAEEIEIKIAQGSKPGEGGQLPAAKVTPYIASLRRAAPGMALISPPPHHDIYSIEDLEQLIHDLGEVNPGARIGVKLVAGAGVGIIATGVAKAGADVITISGHDGGTGASPLGSIKNTGLPWEFGLRDAHRTLCEAGLRQRVRLRVDGGLKFARDVIIAALLGADEFGFGTSALLAIGCVMARQCHLNTCPAGIATQDEALRARFTGKPEMIESYFRGLAVEARKLLAQLGARTLDEIVGQAQFLRPRRETHSLWVEDLLRLPARLQEGPDVVRPNQGVSRQLSDVLSGETLPQVSFAIGNADRSVGAGLSGAILRKSGAAAKPAPMNVKFHGSAGPSFGAFLTSGVAFHLTGEANDYVGKGLSGGIISIDAGAEASTRGDVLVGNTVLYGATSGELYVAGAAGERFAVRNSGALAVVEGTGEHGCEYMTGGVVVLLGPAGFNLGSGMTGGLLYQPEQYANSSFLNKEFVEFASCSAEEELLLRRVLMKHCLMTGSPRAAVLLNSTQPLSLVRLQPRHPSCSVTQVWAPLLPHLWAREFAHGNLFQPEFQGISGQPRDAATLGLEQSIPGPLVPQD